MPSRLKIYVYTTSYHENITMEHPAFQTEGWLKRSQEVQDKWLHETLSFQEISGELSVRSLIDRIISVRNYPKWDNEGENIGYYLRRLEQDEISTLEQKKGLKLAFALQGDTLFHESATLNEEMIRDEDELLLYPGINAGGPDPLTVAAGLASIVQVMLMIIDMWQRRSKGSRTSKGKSGGAKIRAGNDKAWLAVREIRIEMSDGNWIKFDQTGLINLDRIKKFIEIFDLPSQSPKPIKVVFVLQNGSKVFLNVSSDANSKEQIERLLEFLRGTF